MKLDSRRLETFSGVIEEKSNKELDHASSSLSSQTGGDLQTEIDPTTGMIKPRSVSYQARVPLERSDLVLRPGYRGSAKIHVDPMSLGNRLWRVIAKTFNFELVKYACYAIRGNYLRLTRALNSYVHDRLTLHPKSSPLG